MAANGGQAATAGLNLRLQGRPGRKCRTALPFAPVRANGTCDRRYINAKNGTDEKRDGGATGRRPGGTAVAADARSREAGGALRRRLPDH